MHNSTHLTTTKTLSTTPTHHPYHTNLTHNNTHLLAPTEYPLNHINPDMVGIDVLR